ncbi:336_t:CDS:2 [Paraglomus occultum]|uniref:Restriction of telomere capping protein 5 n=1 Tax=Paraglomus occultum TaxID=144539 RepID=A0A9N9ARC5_9GLOM|nr:336_t:CDS:2 [Paraglomus occultum]
MGQIIPSAVKDKVNGSNANRVSTVKCHVKQHRYPQPNAHVRTLLQNLKHIEQYSLRTTFDNIADDNDGVIKEDAFVNYLGLPDKIGIGPLLYKSFKYLATYPDLRHDDESSLTFDGLTIAIAIYCDKATKKIQEDKLKLLFDSFATIPEPLVSNETVKDPSSHSTLISDMSDLSSLKLKFDDAEILKILGIEQEGESAAGIDSVSRIYCKDMLSILTGLTWIMSTQTILALDENTDTRTNLFNHLSPENIAHIYDQISLIVQQMERYDSRQRSLSNIDLSNQVITWPTFKKFVHRNVPNIFNGFRAFFTSQFLIGQTLSQPRSDSPFVGPNSSYWATLDKPSDILSDPTKMAILSWMLPGKSVTRRQWQKLYSGREHGFSMNRFETRVFKYPGPTLILINAEVLSSKSLTQQNGNGEYCSSKENVSMSHPQTLILGAYIAEPWKSTSSLTKCFGSEDCFLFELYPTFEVFPSSKRNTNYVYYNSSIGLGFGGLPTSGKTSNKLENQECNSFFLQLDYSLQFGRYRNDPLREIAPTYMLSETRNHFDTPFEVIEIEVFGLGGDMAKQKQESEWLWEEKDVKKRRSLKSNSGKVDNELLKMAGVINEDLRREVRL